MLILKRFLDFYINGSIHVAMAVFAFVSMTMYFFGVTDNFEVKAFAFFGTIVGYNFVKNVDLVFQKKTALLKKNRFIIVLSFCSAIASLYCFLKLQWMTQVFGIFFFILLLFYALPFLPKKQNVRNWKGVKIYIVSLCWVGVTVLMPLINTKIIFSSAVLLLCAQRFILVFVLMLIFEIIDITTDNPDLKTVPQQLGIEKTKLLGNTLLIVFLLLEFLYEDKQGYIPLFYKCIISSIIALFLYFAHEKRSRYYASFWVESIPIFWWFMMFLLK